MNHQCGVEQRLARQSHNLEVGGSNPPPATNSGRIHEPDRPEYAPGASVSLGSSSLKLASPVLDVHAPGAGVFFGEVRT